MTENNNDVLIPEINTKKTEGKISIVLLRSLLLSIGLTLFIIGVSYVIGALFLGNALMTLFFIWTSPFIMVIIFYFAFVINLRIMRPTGTSKMKLIRLLIYPFILAFIITIVSRFMLDRILTNWNILR